MVRAEADEAPGTTRARATESSFLFADLAGYTALTEAHGDDRAADLALGFFDRVRALISERRCALIKTLGDAVMVRAEDAATAVLLGIDIERGIGRHHGWPPVRVGIHTGHAVERSGDWFGAAVNVAARTLDAAKAGQVVVTAATRAATESREVDFRALGSHELRNVVVAHDLYQALPAGTSPSAPLIDPVCRMSVDRARCERWIEHEGVAHPFCSDACAAAFAAAPGRYAGSAGAS